ncbi:type II toxin-antitoxin system VapC family toxin [Nocardiopsis alba]|uniref:type II toxin-antitoxin system VapC family toxin n=1 Tax=Nocardiopsis alba TaxID=53437 RepID=UPI00366ECD47
MIVVDTSALINALTSEGEIGKVARDRLGSEELTTPALIDWEVSSVLLSLSKPSRGRAAGLPRRDRDLAMNAFERLTIVRYGLHPLWPRMRELANNLSGYDAAYVALAEQLDVPLVTADRRIERGARTTATIEVL